MSSKPKSKRNSPKTSGKTKDTVRGRKHDKHPAKIEEGSSNLFDFGVAVASGVKEEDIKRIISIQNKSLKSFTKTNELLGKFNDFSSSKYDVLQHMFVQHTRLLVELKKDLTNIFLRIRNLKVQLEKQHPEAFEATFNLRKDLEERLESELSSEATYIDKTEWHNVDERKNKTKSLLNEDQVLTLKLDEKKESGKGSTGTASITENVEQTREADLKSKCQELDAKVMAATKSLEIVKENEVEVTEENQVKIGEADVDLAKDDDKQERAEDNPEQTKCNLNETKKEVEKIEDNLGTSEDNPEQTKGNLNETKEVEKIEDNLGTSEDNPEQTKHNLDGSEENLGRKI